MLNPSDIMETINMIREEHLDIRTVTMGISLSCIDSDIDKACAKIYDKITGYAERLVPVCDQIQSEYGIPIINRRISVTPYRHDRVGVPSADITKFAKTLEKAANELGVNFVGGYSALVQKGFSDGDYALIESIPRALAETDHVCASVNGKHQSGHKYGRGENDGKGG